MGEASQTFLFADLAGFTALTEAHGDEQAADTAAAFFTCVRDQLGDYRADEVKTIGDAVMVRSETARDAVLLALGIVEAVEAEPLLPTVRVGMDTGQGVEREGDWFGSAVNTAARLAGAAAGAEVLLSEGTYRAAGELSGVEFRRHGEIRLKNLPVPTLVYAVVRVGGRDGDLAIDPVCRMVIAENAAAGRLIFDGVEYEFCSLDCAGKFAADPERYLPPP